MTMRMRLQSTTQGQLHGNSNLDQMHSRIQVPNMSYAHSQGQSIPHEDLPPDQVLFDNTRTHNTHLTTSYHPVTRLTMMRHYEPAFPRFSLLQLQLEVFRSQARLAQHQSQRPAVSILHLCAWYLKQ